MPEGRDVKMACEGISPALWSAIQIQGKAGGPKKQGFWSWPGPQLNVLFNPGWGHGVPRNGLLCCFLRIGTVQILGDAKLTLAITLWCILASEGLRVFIPLYPGGYVPPWYYKDSCTSQGCW